VVPTLLLIAVLTSLLAHFVPGQPCIGDRIQVEGCQRWKDQRGLNDPWWRQFGFDLANYATGDMGRSQAHGDLPVKHLIAAGARVSATLGALALALSVTAGVGLGVVSALRRNTAVDYLAVGFATLAASVPTFILGILLLVLFVQGLHWLPSMGWGTPQQAIMPVLALSALPAAYIARVTRAAMLDAQRQEYVRTARAKGLRERTVVWRHILGNALIPVLTVIGPIAAALVTGSFVVEYLFSIPGIGRAFVHSVQMRDHDMIMATTLLYAFVVTVANLAVDLAYTVVDPRIRQEAHG
jgi:oligopeptide transport system permease protein